MFAVSDDDVAAIRAAFDAGGELAAAVEIRRRFRGITDDDVARDWARRMMAWSPVPVPGRPPKKAPRSGISIIAYPVVKHSFTVRAESPARRKPKESGVKSRSPRPNH